MYQLVCKLFIFSSLCLQSIYLGFFTFANKFFRIFHPPLQKNNGPSLRNVSFTFDFKKLLENELRFVTDVVLEYFAMLEV